MLKVKNKNKNKNKQTKQNVLFSLKKYYMLKVKNKNKNKPQRYKGETIESKTSPFSTALSYPPRP